MSPIEIIFVILGIILIVGSCFLHGTAEKGAVVTEIPEEVLEFQKKEAEKMVQQILDEKTEEAVVKADDYLSRISNEKIMSVNDYSNQILERIDGNHKEVVFLYDMLNQKEDEIKQVVQNFEQKKQQMLETVEELSAATKQMSAEENATENVVVKKTSNETFKKTEHKKKETVSEVEPKKIPEVVKEPETPIEYPEMINPDGQKEEILKMYKQGKSVLEISKALGMGQGEVKLIIGLYGL